MIKKIIFVSILTLLTLELALRTSGLFVSGIEKRFHKYTSPYKITSALYGENPYYYLHKKNHTYHEKFPEFQHIFTTNALGFPDKPIPIQKNNKETRIFCIGDSFTEGVGSGGTNTWPAYFQKQISKLLPSSNIQSYNCGIAGSDICAEFILLQEILYKYKPDILIFAINTSDIKDIIISGGPERFQKNKHHVIYKPDPWWEPLYHYSYIVRLLIHSIFGYSGEIFEIKRSQRSTLDKEAINTINQTIVEINKYAKTKNIKAYFFFHPYPDEVEKECYAYKSFISTLNNKTITSFDLLETFRLEKTITSKNYSDYYWSLDPHHNSAGYKTMGETIARIIATQLKTTK